MRDNIEAIHEGPENDDYNENKGTMRLVRNRKAGGRVDWVRDYIKAIHEGLENDDYNENKGTVRLVRN